MLSYSDVKVSGEYGDYGVYQGIRLIGRVKHTRDRYGKVIGWHYHLNGKDHPSDLPTRKAAVQALLDEVNGS